MEIYALLVADTLNAGTILAIASLGLLINEKAGIVNLGAEGMMLCAAIAGFATVVHTGSDVLGFAAGMGAGAVLAAVFGVLVIWLNTNQYATGLALSLFGAGLSTPTELEPDQLRRPDHLGPDVRQPLRRGGCRLVGLRHDEHRQRIVGRGLGSVDDSKGI